MIDKGSLITQSLSDPIIFGSLVCRLAWSNQSPPFQELDTWQKAILSAKERYLYLNCSRQSGKSTILMVNALYTALTEPNSLVLVVAEQRQSNEDIRKVRELMYAYRKWLDRRSNGAVTANLLVDNITSLEFHNRSRIIALPANEKVRGYSAPRMVIIDEAGYVGDEVFVGLDPMLEVSKGQLILASTPHGTSGFYYTESKNGRYRGWVIPWQMCPRIKRESILQKRLIYGEAYVQQEYECKFLDDVSALFTERSLRDSFDDSEDPFLEKMETINKVLHGEVELI